MYLHLPSVIDCMGVVCDRLYGRDDGGGDTYIHEYILIYNKCI